MTIKERYPKLQDPVFLKQMILKSVHGSMALEDQEVSMEKLSEIYDAVLKEPRPRPQSTLMEQKRVPWL